MNSPSQDHAPTAGDAGVDSPPRESDRLDKHWHRIGTGLIWCGLAMLATVLFVSVLLVGGWTYNATQTWDNTIWGLGIGALAIFAGHRMREP